MSTLTAEQRDRLTQHADYLGRQARRSLAADLRAALDATAPRDDPAPGGRAVSTSRCAGCKARVVWVRTTGGLTIAATVAEDLDGDLRHTGQWAPHLDGTEIPEVTAVRGVGQFRRHRDVCDRPARRARALT